MPSKRLATAGMLIMIAAGFGSSVSAQAGAALDPVGETFWTGAWPSIESCSRGGGARTEATSGTVAADDPRIAGTMTDLWNTAAAASVESAEGELSITNGTSRIDNADGAWVGTSTSFGGSPGQESWFVMEGEGAYEGLTTVFRWHAADSSLEGIIVPAGLPALPDPVAPPTE
jgi:hypothetical protein